MLFIAPLFLEQHPHTCFFFGVPNGAWLLRSQVGCHSVDEDLLCLCQQPPPGGTHVVTRNSCRDDIRTFLRQQVLFVVVARLGNSGKK
jgi:hypothetical protein